MVVAIYKYDRRPGDVQHPKFGLPHSSGRSHAVATDGDSRRNFWISTIIPIEGRPTITISPYLEYWKSISDRPLDADGLETSPTVTMSETGWSGLWGLLTISRGRHWLNTSISVSEIDCINHIMLYRMLRTSGVLTSLSPKYHVEIQSREFPCSHVPQSRVS